MRPISQNLMSFPLIFMIMEIRNIFKLNNKCPKNPCFNFLATFPHAYSNGISMFLKYETVDEYRAGVGFHFVKMISYLTKSDIHMF